MTRILSEPSLHVEQDSSINLTCITNAGVQQDGKSLPYSDAGMLWYKNEKVISQFMNIKVILGKT